MLTHAVCQWSLNVLNRESQIEAAMEIAMEIRRKRKYTR